MDIFSKKTVPPPDPIKEDFTSPKRFVLLTDVDAEEVEKCINDHFKHGYNIESKSINTYCTTFGQGTRVFCFTAEIVFVKKNSPGV